MPNIWREPPDGWVTGPGIVAEGWLDIAPTNPYLRQNPACYEGAITGYNEVGEFSSLQYTVLGTRILICSYTSIDAADKETVTDDLNTGCNFGIDDVNATHGAVDPVGSFAHPVYIAARTGENTLAQAIKGGWLSKGIYLDTLQTNPELYGPDYLPEIALPAVWSDETYSYIGFVLQTPSADAQSAWNTLLGEAAALWAP